MFPVYVGMNRIIVNTSDIEVNVPRVRRDESDSDELQDDDAACSPCT